MADILRDIRDAFRSARTEPGVTLVIVLTLAAGTGASTAIFTYFVELYWYRLDAPDAERLYRVTSIAAGRGPHFRPASGGCKLGAPRPRQHLSPPGHS